MDEKEKKLIIRFCHAERLKSSILNLMEIFLRFQDYIAQEQKEPSGRTFLSWFLNLLFSEISRAANISHSKELTEAQNQVSMIITQLEMSGPQPDFQQIMDILRNTITRITSEAANAAKELNFG